MEAHANLCLVLEIDEHVAEVAAQAGNVEFNLGRDDRNDFVVGGEFASRRHARIIREHKDFYLVDFSTNGTYVQTEDEQVTHVHRGKLKLWGEGWISLGEPLNLGQPIHYRRA
jgi:pSer/pThr/pTyr-binding forkhead associated (FHA) protein